MIRIYKSRIIFADFAFISLIHRKSGKTVIHFT